MSQSPDFRTRMNFEYGVARELTPGVLRLVANNPSPLTFKGTNTYILGSREIAVIDPGPEDAEHFAAIMRAADGRRITHIILTHTHHDHYDGLPRLAAETGAITCGFGRKVAPGTAHTAPDGSERSDRDFEPAVVLSDNASVEGDGWRITALHTPGHAPDHLCLALEGTGVLFSGDNVMAWNTSVVGPPDGSMADYLASLQRLVGRGDTLYLPGHGGKLAEPERMVRAFIWHRGQRERQILDVLRSAKADTIGGIVSLVYPGLDPRLVRAASLSVQAHVEHLIAQGHLTCDGPVTFDRRLSLA